MVIDIPQPGKVPPGTAPCRFLGAIRPSHLGLSIALLDPEKDTAVLAHEQCPKTRRPHLLPAKVHLDIEEEPIQIDHLHPLPHEMRSLNLKNAIAFP